MKIRTALTLKNTLATAAVFLACLAAVYLVSEHTRSRTFYHTLQSEAVTKAHLFLQGRVDARTMQEIYLNNRNFIDEVEVAVYSADARMLYHDAIRSDIVKEDSAMIARIRDLHRIEFRVGKYQAIGMLYRFGGEDYIVTAAAYDRYGHANLAQLRMTLATLLLIGVLLLFATGYLLARAALQPMRGIVQQAGAITASRIDRRLPVKNARDELGELALAFNDLLARLETSFHAQKQFVSNVSHELRTPLAALIAELDLALQKERSGEHYRRAMGRALQDARRMTRLIDGLLNLAKADYRQEQIKMEEIRLDELLLDVRSLILRAHPDYRIELLFEQEEADDERMITVEGNLHLLTIAFTNLIENNCKYSGDRLSCVHISYWNQWAILRFSDAGVGMTEEELRNLFTLFYRGGQESMAEGHGIGMALARKIVQLHRGRIAVHSEAGQGTTFVVELPHV